MIRAFIDSWPLFQSTYCAAMLVSLVLGLLGTMLVAQQQVFFGAAVSQASTLGIAINLFMGWTLAVPMAVGSSLVAALLATRGRARSGGASSEEATGWVFLACSSLSILLLAHHPQGLREIQQILASSLIGADMSSVLYFAGAGLTIFVFVALNWRRLVLFISDPIMAAACGIKIERWELFSATVLGLAAGYSIYTTGMLFTFGCLVLPAVIAKNLCREIAPMFMVAPVTAVFGALLGLILANQYDFPPGQMIVAVYSGALLVAWVWRSFREWMWAG